ncbi:hypothetical protein HU200_060857 [Digitaria exilis]|uniref:Uncharacterized protein n=1 Tax=Digitaria exilis TaxID=1010633 RepID=A0A835AIG3_9POAL|nr:hypothetical protein HU200_060857 [Digitaria exilis]
MRRFPCSTQSSSSSGRLHTRSIWRERMERAPRASAPDAAAPVASAQASSAAGTSTGLRRRSRGAATARPAMEASSVRPARTRRSAASARSAAATAARCWPWPWWSASAMIDCLLVR